MKPIKLVNFWMVIAMLASFVTPVAGFSAAHQPDQLTVTLDPALALDDFPLHQAVKFLFNLPMSPLEVNEPEVLFSPYVEGESVWNETRTELVFTPDVLLGDTNYHIYLHPDLKSETQIQFAEPPHWQVHTQNRVEVTKVFPDLEKISHPLTWVLITFSAPMDEASVLAALSISSDAYQTSWNVSKKTLTIKFDQPINQGDVAISLDYSAHDINGNPLAQRYGWDYDIREFSISEVNIGYNSVYFTFSHEVSTENNFPLTISPALDGEWLWIDQRLYFDLTGDLPYSTVFTVNTTGTFYDPSGSPYANPPEVTFQTDPPLHVTSGTLADSIGISFEVDVDRNSVEKALLVTPALEGEISWSKNRLSFTPTAPISNQVYTFTLDVSAKSTNDRALLLEPIEIWKGVFGAVSSGADFGIWGANIQVLDANGERLIQFQNDPDHLVTLSLYKMDATQFIAAYEASAKRLFNYSYYYGERPASVDKQGLSAIKTWQIESSERVDSMQIPRDVPSGFYLLTVSADKAFDLPSELFLVLSPNTLVAKLSGRKLWVWANDINGGPVSGHLMTAHAANGEMLATAETNENGVAELTLPEGKEAVFVTGQSKGIISACGLDANWRELSYDSTTGYYEYYRYFNNLGITGFVYTDRPLYQPAQVVNFKGIFRADDDLQYQLLPAGQQVTAALFDPAENLLETQSLLLSDFGTVNGAFTLAEMASTGTYTIKFSVGEYVLYAKFEVDFYRKPDIVISMELDQNSIISGSETTVKIHAAYLFGQPLANQTLKLSYQWLERNYGWDTNGKYYAKPINLRELPKEVILDANGDAEITIKAPKVIFDDYSPGYYNNWLLRYGKLLNIEAKYVEMDGEAIISNQQIRVYQNALNLYTTLSWWQTQNSELKGFIVVEDRAGNALDAQSVNVVIDYARFRRNEETQVYEETLTSNINGQVKVNYIPEAPGFYRVAITSEDVYNNKVVLMRTFWVFDESYTFWQQYDYDALDLQLSANEFSIGETTEILIRSEFSGLGILTVERGSVLHEQLVTLTAPVTKVTLNMLESFAPNAFITVAAFKPQDTTTFTEGYRESDYYYSMSMPDCEPYISTYEIKVKDVRQPLTIEIVPEKAIYQPQEEAVFNITVYDASGKPVEAELSAALVDEAIFLLNDDLTRNIFDVFYGERDHWMTDFTSMTPHRYFEGPGERGGGGDGDFGGTIRQDFPDTALWLPAIKTDANGKATIKTILPDSLTTWRLTVYAVTRLTEVGEGRTTIMTTKPMVINTLLPSVFTVGDAAQLVALIHNTTEESLMVTYSLHTELLDVTGRSIRKVMVNAGEVVPVLFTVTAKDVGVGTAVFSANADVDGVEDAILLSYTVNQKGTAMMSASSGSFMDQLFTTVRIDENASSDTGLMKLWVGVSPVSLIMQDLDDLIKYPYGCVEQISSQMIANTTVSRMQEAWQLSAERRAELDEFTRAGLAKIYSMQHSDGMWGWWYDSDNDPYLTALVLFNLALVQEAGYEVEQKVINRAIETMQYTLDDTTSQTTLAIYLQALSIMGKTDEAVIARLQAKTGRQDAFSLSALAIALENLNRHTEAVLLLKDIEQNIIRDQAGAFVPVASSSSGYYEYMMSTDRTTAMVLLAFLAVEPDNPLIDELVNHLILSNRPKTYWTTIEKSTIVYALTEHFRINAGKLAEANSDASYSILLNGEEVGKIDSIDVLTGKTIMIEGGTKGINRLQLDAETGSHLRLFYRLQSIYHLVGGGEDNPVGITITRKVFDAKGKNEIVAVEVGDLVKVELTIKADSNFTYMMLTDPLAAGFEAVNHDMNNTSFSERHYRYDGYYTWYPSGYAYQNKEIRPGKVIFFITQVGKGELTLSYYARALFTGSFIMEAPVVENMYFSEIRAVGIPTHLVILSKEKP